MEKDGQWGGVEVSLDGRRERSEFPLRRPEGTQQKMDIDNRSTYSLYSSEDLKNDRGSKGKTT